MKTALAATVFTALAVGVPTVAGAAVALEFARTSATVKVPVGEKSVTTEFPFTNTATTPVAMVRVATSCGCTVAETDKPRYAPGETGVVVAIFQVNTAEGTQRETISIITDGKPAHQYLLTLVVEIPPAARSVPTASPVQPARLLWMRSPYEPKTVTVDSSDVRWETLSATCDRDTFQVEIRRPPEGQRAAAIEVTPLPSAPSGQAALTVAFEDTAGRIVRHQVALHILPGRTP